MRKWILTGRLFGSIPQGFASIELGVAIVGLLVVVLLVCGIPLRASSHVLDDVFRECGETECRSVVSAKNIIVLNHSKSEQAHFTVLESAELYGAQWLQELNGVCERRSGGHCGNADSFVIENLNRQVRVRTQALGDSSSTEEPYFQCRRSARVHGLCLNENWLTDYEGPRVGDGLDAHPSSPYRRSLSFRARRVQRLNLCGNGDELLPSNGGQHDPRAEPRRKTPQDGASGLPVLVMNEHESTRNGQTNCEECGNKCGHDSTIFFALGFACGTASFFVLAILIVAARRHGR